MQEENKNYCTLYLVRHGETEWNVKHITQGQSESSLTELGIQQAKNVASEFKDIHFDAIFSSDLSRTQRTAEIIKLDRDIIIQTSELLRERNFGKFEGKHSDEYREALKEKLEMKENLSGEEGWSFEVSDDINEGFAIMAFIFSFTPSSFALTFFERASASRTVFASSRALRFSEASRAWSYEALALFTTASAAFIDARPSSSSSKIMTSSSLSSPEAPALKNPPNIPPAPAFAAASAAFATAAALAAAAFTAAFDA